MVGEQIAGRYELEELAGTGGMSSVYRARDTLLERHVALKLLHEYHGADQESIERFRREARAVAQLSHPNIVTVIDRGEDGDRQFIVFEYVDGENLKELVTRVGPLPVRRALELGIQIGEGLSCAHENGVVHRDVKPQNVLLNGDGQAKVTDFGIARSLDVEHGMTQTGTVIGTSNYIAPEQASGRPVDERTDVYSLGVVLFELLTGDVPFPGENFVAVALRHVHDEPPSVLERRPDAPLRVVHARRARAREGSRRPVPVDDGDGRGAARMPRRRRGPTRRGRWSSRHAPWRSRRPRALGVAASGLGPSSRSSSRLAASSRSPRGRSSSVTGPVAAEERGGGAGAGAGAPCGRRGFLRSRTGDGQEHRRRSPGRRTGIRHVPVHGELPRETVAQDEARGWVSCSTREDFVPGASSSSAPRRPGSPQRSARGTRLELPVR